MADLSGKRALVTGAASGLGKAIAAAFVASGARVMLSDIDEDGVGKVAADLGAGSIRCDVADPAEVERAVHATVEVFGGVDVVVNNAGIEVIARLAEMDEADFDRIVAVNLKGVWLGIKYGAPAIAASGGGAIVNMSSVAGLGGWPGVGAYCATKAGVISLTQTAALEWRDAGVRVNAVCPAFIDTPMVERAIVQVGPILEADLGLGGDRILHNVQRRLGVPTEVAEGVAYLASDAASFVSGIALPIDNAFTARLF
jgi:NAD(P)-dependent dehydrogenase (short-subunit alcohol dehydrogenase family)